MKFTPANIANSLKRSGIPICISDKKGKVDGVKVTSLNGRVNFTYTVWGEVYDKVTGNAGQKEGELKVIQALNAIGYDATEYAPRGTGTGLFRIHTLKSE